MGKNPAGSEVIASHSNLSALLTASNYFHKDDIDASNEALKCIANALLLIESSRSLFVRKEVGGSEAIVDLLEVGSHPGRVLGDPADRVWPIENHFARAHLSGLPNTLPHNCFYAPSCGLYPQPRREQTSRPPQQHHRDHWLQARFAHDQYFV